MTLFSGRLQGVSGRGGVDSLMATFNNYELQFFVEGELLKKRLPVYHIRFNELT